MLARVIEQPYGMILVTGPTGSGKTTTLYSCLNEKDVMTDSIVTLEDPVEYQLSGINQVQIDTEIDLTFSSVLRASLRQDIEVLLVGEIRDPETARIAVRAAMTWSSGPWARTSSTVVLVTTVWSRRPTWGSD